MSEHGTCKKKDEKIFFHSFQRRYLMKYVHFRLLGFYETSLSQQQRGRLRLELPSLLFYSVKALFDYTAGFTFMTQTVILHATASNTTARGSRGTIGMRPRFLCQLKPVQWDVMTAVCIVAFALERRIIDHSRLKYSEALLPSPKFCSFCFHRLFLLK